MFKSGILLIKGIRYATGSLGYKGRSKIEFISVLRAFTSKPHQYECIIEQRSCTAGSVRRFQSSLKPLFAVPAVARDWHCEKASLELLPANSRVHPPEGLGADASPPDGVTATVWHILSMVISVQVNWSFCATSLVSVHIEVLLTLPLIKLHNRLCQGF